MFWRSVVGKLAMTILLLVSFVLFILTILLLEFFEGFHVQEAEKAMLQTVARISTLVNEHEDEDLVKQMTERVREPSSKVFIFFPDGEIWASNTTDELLKDIDVDSLSEHDGILDVINDHEPLNKKINLTDGNVEIMVIGVPLIAKSGGIIVYQSLDVINQTRAETTKIIFVAAAIAIVLTTIFAFFLSTRITAPLIQMREAAIDLTKGKFNKKVPIVTHDEIGELAFAFNHMGEQLNYHIDALRQEKEQLSSIVNSMADGVVTLNRSGHITVINPPAERFIQDCYYESNIQVNDGKYTILPDILKSIFDKIIQEEKEILHEINIQGRNWVMIMTPLYDNESIRGAVAVIRDMTEERQLDKLRKDFIANVSHELRTPISLMQGYSEAIVDDIASSNEDKNELAQIIHDESLRMGRLVNELLDIGRMEAGHIELNYTDVKIDQFINRIFNKFKGMAEEKKIQLNLNKQLIVQHCYFDDDRIEQVCTNLIDNALHHTGINGTVSIDVRTTEEYLTVSVHDTGSGISEEDLTFIFERFYKADKSRTRQSKRQGTGLGLAIAKHIVDAHKGTITAKSKIGIGTTFSFTIPHDQS